LFPHGPVVGAERTSGTTPDSFHTETVRELVPARGAGLLSGQRAIAIRFPHPACPRRRRSFRRRRPPGAFSYLLPLSTPRAPGRGVISPLRLAPDGHLRVTWGLEVTKGASDITTISRHDEQWNSPPEASFWKSVKHRNVSWLYSRPLCFFVILLLLVYMSKVKTGCCFVNSIRFGYWQVRTSSSPRWTKTWCR